MPVTANATDLIKAHLNQVAKNTFAPDAPVKLIEGFEGCRLHAYLDTAGVATIGWGSTYYLDGSRVKMGDTITQATADLLLAYVVQQCGKEVLALVKVALNVNQYDALASFEYNEGEGALSMSTLLKKLNAGDYAGAADEFLKWDKITNPQTHQKEVLNDLYIRRTKERELFLTPINN